MDKEERKKEGYLKALGRQNSCSPQTKQQYSCKTATITQSMFKPGTTRKSRLPVIIRINNCCILIMQSELLIRQFAQTAQTALSKLPQAGGFLTVLEARHWRSKHYMVGFSRGHTPWLEDGGRLTVSNL